MKQKGLNNFGAKGWWIVIFVGLLYLISSATVDLLNVTPQLFQAVKGWDQNQLLVFSAVGSAWCWPWYSAAGSPPRA